MPKRVRKKRKYKVGRLIIAIIILLAILFGIYKLLDFAKNNINIITKEYYLASNTNLVTLYSYNEETKQIEESEKISRGTIVKSNDKIKMDDEVEYLEIKLDDKSYLVKKDNITSNKKDVVTEKEKYVRTSVTIYQNEKDSKIASFIKKGNKLQILDYDYFDDDGLVNMYKVKNDSKEGWVYRKYLVDTEEEAQANYNENGVYDIHKDRKYSRELYGGKASTLDYYPFERVEFENNPLLKVAKAMYLNAGTISGIDSYLEIAKSSGVNAMVVDIKDGALGFALW